MNGNRDAARRDGMRGAAAARSDRPVASRREALSTLTSHLLSGEPSLLLLTGESGAGKSWLCGRLGAELPAGWRLQAVDLTEGLDAREFLVLLRHGLGLSPAEGVAVSRIGLTEALEEDARDGRHRVLVVENAEAAGKAVWTELLALVHAMEGGVGYRAILLVGSTALASQLSGRGWDPVASRLAAHVHLLPLDVDECRELLLAAPAPELRDQAALERLHRDAAGNPRRVLQLASRRMGPAAPSPAVPTREAARVAELSPPAERVGSRGSIAAPAERPAPVAAEPAPRAALAPSEVSIPTASMAPAQLLPSRPPLRVEEGLVEVGWAGNLEAESQAPDLELEEELEEELIEEPPVTNPVESPGEESVEDHYAALQAWNEWAVNRRREATPAAEPTQAGSSLTPAEDETEPEAADSEEAVSRVLAGLRAEPQHEHAPYSQLFSRLRQSS